MITTTFNGQTGSGIRMRVVAPLARAQRGRITVVSPRREMVEQWQKMLPDAECLTTSEWRRRADDPAGTLIIVDGMTPTIFPQYVATLESVAAEVWIVGLEQWQLTGRIRQVFARGCVGRGGSLLVQEGGAA